MRPATFVILCLGRVGSELLVSLLDSHPDICCYGELFAPPHEPHEEWADPHLPDGVPAFAQSGHDDPELYLSGLASACDGAAFGFKLPRSSIRAHPNAVALLDNPEVRVIRLTRENLLAQHVSAILAFLTGVWKQGGQEESYGEVAHHVDPAGCKRALVKLEVQEQEMDRLAEGHPTMRLTYEELIAGSRMDEAQRFLGVEPRRLSSDHRKLRTRSMHETIENWDELSAELRGTRFERFLAEAP
jgi:LPS sulfotransferase NodH